ncbi:MAG: alpha/beta fold hydrolase [Chloroflexi bacterium]|nr:alpha/beta fold hydrolase [Chloroflexota bacterium]
MLAANNASLETFENWTLRVRTPSQTPARVLLMLHGWTGDENSTWVFARNFPTDTLILAPRGLHLAPQGGYSWRPPRADSFGRPSLDDFCESAEALIRLVDAYAARGPIDARQFDVMGFSQGAALSNVIACLHPDRIRKAAILAGFMPSGMEEIVAKKPLSGKPVFVTHGTQDNLVPIDRARASMSLLEQAGAHVTYCEAEVGHKVSADCLRALESFFKD